LAHQGYILNKSSTHWKYQKAAAMPETTKFIANNVFHIIKILELMKQPNGTSIEELCKKLPTNRRSAFRLLKTIEKKLHIPFKIRRGSFGGAASYHLSPAFAEKLSCINLPELSLTFNQAVFVYLLLNNDSSPCGNVPDEIGNLMKRLEILYKQ
jgi:hypothetical protein